MMLQMTIIYVILPAPHGGLWSVDDLGTLSCGPCVEDFGLWLTLGRSPVQRDFGLWLTLGRCPVAPEWRTLVFG